MNIATGFGGTAQGIPNKDGSAGTPGTVKNCIVQFCAGGELDNQTGSGVTLATPLTRGDIYTRLSYDLTPDTEIYMTMNWSQVGTSNIPNPDMWLGSLPGISGGGDESNTASAGFSPNPFCPIPHSIPGRYCRRPAFSAAPWPAAPMPSCPPRSRPPACRVVPPLPALQASVLVRLYYGNGPQEVYTPSASTAALSAARTAATSICS